MNSRKMLLIGVCGIVLVIIQISIIFTFSQTPILHLPILFSILVFFYLPAVYAFLFAALSMFFLDIYSGTPFGTSVIVTTTLLSVALIITRSVLPIKSLVAKLSITIFLTIGYVFFLRSIEYMQLTIFKTQESAFITPGFIGHTFWLTICHMAIIFFFDKFYSRPRWFKPRPYFMKTQ